MLGIRRYLQFDSPLLRFLGRLAHASSALGSASASSDRDPGTAVLLPFITHIILLSLIFAVSQRRAEAASFLHCVCSRCPTFQPIPLRSTPTVPSLP